MSILINCPITNEDKVCTSIPGEWYAFDNLKAGGKYNIIDSIFMDKRFNDLGMKKKLYLEIWKENRNGRTFKIDSSVIDRLEKQPSPSIEVSKEAFLQALHEMPLKRNESCYMQRIDEYVYSHFPLSKLLECFFKGVALFDFIKGLDEKNHIKVMPDGKTINFLLGEKPLPKQETDNPIAMPVMQEMDKDDWEPLPKEKNSQELLEAIKKLTAAIEAIREDNGYAANKPDERNAVLLGVESGKTALEEQDKIFRHQVKTIYTALFKAQKTFTILTNVGKKILEAINAMDILTRIWKWFNGTP